MGSESDSDFAFIEFDGKYVHLAPLALSHAQGLLDAANVSRATFKFTGVPSDLILMKTYIEDALVLRSLDLAVPFAIIDKVSGKVVGTTRFGNIEYWPWPESNPHKRPSGVPDAVEIGWTWISEPYQRTGTNTETKILLLTHAFEVWKVHRVNLRTDARNEKSRRNIERVGAKLDGVLRGHMPAYDGAIRDTASYSIVAAEWPKIKAKLTAKLK